MEKERKEEKEVKRSRTGRSRIYSTVLVLAFLVQVFSGCNIIREEDVKLEDVGFTVVSEEKIPEELKTIIEEKNQEAFQLTYSDKEYLYIVIGYGQQDSGGYSIAVNELYLTEDALHVNTTLLGPKPEPVPGDPVKTSVPYIVLKIDYMEKPVIFE